MPSTGDNGNEPSSEVRRARDEGDLSWRHQVPTGSAGVRCLRVRQADDVFDEIASAATFFVARRSASNKGASIDQESHSARARRLANEARRLAGLMHQPQVRQELLAEAEQLEREAEQLSGASERVSSSGPC